MGVSWFPLTINIFLKFISIAPFLYSFSLVSSVPNSKPDARVIKEDMVLEVLISFFCSVVLVLMEKNWADRLIGSSLFVCTVIQMQTSESGPSA